MPVPPPPPPRPCLLFALTGAVSAGAQVAVADGRAVRDEDVGVARDESPLQQRRNMAINTHTRTHTSKQTNKQTNTAGKYLFAAAGSALEVEGPVAKLGLPGRAPKADALDGAAAVLEISAVCQRGLEAGMSRVGLSPRQLSARGWSSVSFQVTLTAAGSHGLWPNRLPRRG